MYLNRHMTSNQYAESKYIAIFGQNACTYCILLAHAEVFVVIITYVCMVVTLNLDLILTCYISAR